MQEETLTKPVTNKSGKRERLEIRLNEDEKTAYKKWEKDNNAERLCSKLVRLILREIITDSPELNGYDLGELRKAKTQLRHIGLNLNQITKQVNQNPNNLDKITVNYLQQLENRIDNVVDEINNLYVKCRKRKAYIVKQITPDLS